MNQLEQIARQLELAKVAHAAISERLAQLKAEFPHSAEVAYLAKLLEANKILESQNQQKIRDAGGSASAH